MFVIEDESMLIENPLDLLAEIYEIVTEMEEYYGV